MLLYSRDNTGALPVFSFGSDGYSYFVAVTNSRGSPLFRHRVTPEDTVARVLKAIVKRAVLCASAKRARALRNACAL